MNISFLFRTVAVSAVAAVSCCLAAQDDIIPLDCQSVFKSKTPYILTYTEDGGGSVSEFVYPVEKTPEGNRISSVIELIRGSETADYSEHTTLRCYCKRKNGLYDCYLIYAPFESEEPLVFSCSYEVKKDCIVSTTKGKKGDIVLDFYSYKMPEKLLESHKKTIRNAKSDSAFEATRACFLAISAAHAKGGRKAVKELLGDRLDPRDEKDSATESSAESAPAPKSTSKSAGKDGKPHQVQNNMSDTVKVGVTKAAVVRQSSGYTTLSWMVEVTNTGSETISFFSVVHNTLNDDELVIEHSMQNIEKLKPGETRKVKGEEMMENDVWANAVSHEFVVEN